MVRTIKVYLDIGISGIKPEIRRFSMGEDIAYNYKFLCEKISSIFPSLKGKEFSLSWKDNEGDYITMSSDEELAQAVANVEDGVNKVYVIVQSAAAAASDNKPKPLPQNSGDLHPNVVCDGCNGEVHKYRYKCLECSDFDLCDKCHSQDIHPDHDMVKITSPMPHQWLFPGWRRLYSHVFGRTWQGPCGGRGRGRCRQFMDPERKTSGEEPLLHHNEDEAAKDRRDKNAEFLRNIGNTVAAFLDPLGISVNIDVEHANGERESCAPEEKDSNGKGESEKKVSSKTEVPQKKRQEAPLEPLAADNLKRNQNPNSSESATSPTEHKNATVGKDDSNSDNDIPALAEGWTVLNPVNREQNDHNDVPEDKNPVPNKRKAEQNLVQVPSVEKVPLHPDPKIAKALNTMTSMGFDNQGGWLTHLLESKQGNIADVLDTLYPNAGYLGRK